VSASGPHGRIRLPGASYDASGNRLSANGTANSFNVENRLDGYGLPA